MRRKMLWLALPVWAYMTACNEKAQSDEGYIPLPGDTTAVQAKPAPAGQLKLNPPHGQPGHSCDIPEGAPINPTAPALTPKLVQTAAPQPLPSAATTPASAVAPAQAQPATAAGMNPPHGQPGHRCDIAVGAPLNSKPAAPATATPVAKNLTPAVPATAPGMNPPHGQPGHRCDIAVGAPLDSKPAAATTITPAVATPEKKDSASL